MPTVFTHSRGAGVLAASLGALVLSMVPVRPAAQGGPAAAVPPLAPVINQSDDPLLRTFRFRSIGPASMGGRIDDIAVSETDPNVIYLGYAVGGVWKSENNGVTFDPVFDTYTTASIGDIAIHPRDVNIVYVGTGEPNNRQTSSFGDGIYKTTDGGKTFSNIGLKETQTIARIVIDPKNPETVYVASPGHLFGPNPERGIYKTTDGGKTWTLVKFIDNDTGFTDIAIDPVNTNILYAASYQRRRSGCCFNGGGPGSGLWKTADAGRTWTKMTGGGLPPGTYGRIALDVSRSNPNVVYVQIEAGDVGRPQTTGAVQQSADTEATPTAAGAQAAVVPPQPAPTQAGGGGRQGQAPAVPPQPAPTQAGGGGQGRGGGYNWCNNAGPGGGFAIGRGGAAPAPAPPGPRTPPPLDPSRGGLFRSDNKGQSWTQVSNCNSRPMYFSQVRVDPTNDKTVYVMGLPIYKSLDGGRSFASLDDAGGHADPGHVDQHALWIDPKNPRHLLIGNDGGLNISWDQGKTWDFVNTMATALPYIVSADMRRPYYVYIGLQDNGSWGGPSAVRGRGGIMNSHWFGIGGGDGFYTAVDPTDHNIVFTESQNGNTNRYDLRTGRGQSVRPSAGGGRGGGGGGGGGGGRGGINVLNATAGDTYRFNWNTPFQISPHNPKIFWLGGNRLFKSYNQGESYVASPDLTKRVDRNTIAMMGVPGNVSMLSKNDGVTSFSTITTLSESPVMPGVVWIGTDDGNVQVSRDGGSTFTDVSANLPGLAANVHHWISRVEASHFDQAAAYVAVDDHRIDDLKPYIFVTRDFGKTFQSVAGNLPQFGNVQVIREDPTNPDLLFAGTEFGLYASLDRGKSWQKFMNNYPTVRTDDILIHPRDNDLIVATHGRSVWIADDITPLQQLTQAVREADATLFDIRPAVAWLSDRQNDQQVAGQKVFIGENAPRGAAINYYLKAAAPGDVKISIADATGRVIRTLDGPKTAGINRVMWNLAPQPQQGQGGGFGGGGGGRGGGVPVGEGTYLVTLEVAEKKLTKPLPVVQDRWLNER